MGGLVDKRHLLEGYRVPQNLVRSVQVCSIAHSNHRKLSGWDEVSTLEGSGSGDLVDDLGSSNIENCPGELRLHTSLGFRHSSYDQSAISGHLLVPHEEQVRKWDVERDSGKDYSDALLLVQTDAGSEDKDVEEGLHSQISQTCVEFFSCSRRFVLCSFELNDSSSEIPQSADNLWIFFRFSNRESS